MVDGTNVALPQVGRRGAGRGRWDPEVAREAHELLRQSLARPAEERAAYLQTQCAGRPDVLAEAQALLRSMDEASGFLEQPALEQFAEVTEPAESSEHLIGLEIGRYTIQSLIASGGMGSVYLAEQDDPRRTVALKVIRGGIVSPSALRRFRYEAQVLGSLRHPHIAQIFEAAVHRPGRAVEAVPYFAMEYVPGALSLTEYRRASSALAASTSRALPRGLRCRPPRSPERDRPP